MWFAVHERYNQRLFHDRNYRTCARISALIVVQSDALTFGGATSGNPFYSSRAVTLPEKLIASNLSFSVYTRTNGERMMKKSRNTETQIVKFLKNVEAIRKMNEVCSK